MNNFKNNIQIRIAGTEKNSIVDGPGIRYVIFSQGCPLRCEDCHNPQTHDFNGGSLVSIDELAADVKKDPLLDGVTFSGGEPFAQAEAFAALAELLQCHIVCYTGYSFEELYRNPDTHILLSRLDILVDGRFDKNRKSFEQKFRGSKNQRVLDPKESVRRGKAIEIEF